MLLLKSWSILSLNCNDMARLEKLYKFFMCLRIINSNVFIFITLTFELLFFYLFYFFLFHNSYFLIMTIHSLFIYTITNMISILLVSTNETICPTLKKKLCINMWFCAPNFGFCSSSLSSNNWIVHLQFCITVFPTQFYSSSLDY